MKFNKLMKKSAIAFRIYPQARWFYRYIINRKSLSSHIQGLNLFTDFIKKGDLCFDIGANIGKKTEIFLKIGAHVVAFEPQPECVTEIRARCSKYHHLIIEEAVLGSQKGNTQLYVRQSSGQSSLLKDWEGHIESCLSVKMITIDDAIAKYGTPQYCKIDVKGTELEVLKGLTHTIRYISFEYHLTQDNIQKTISCCRHLSRFGKITINVTSAEEERFLLPQWLKMEAFLEFFLNELPNKTGCQYGNIFVCTA